MPIYEYEVSDGLPCTICGGRFELRRTLDRAPLEKCPLCKRPVRKLISPVNSPRVAGPVSLSDAKSAGFTVLKKRDKGVYEKL